MNDALDNTLLGCSGRATGKRFAKWKPCGALPVLVVSLFLGMVGNAHAGSGGAPMDCVILLCMGGGFPANPECNAAKAEVVRRITPNPHSEPPLQAWNCPMGASFSPMTEPVPPARVSQAVGQNWSVENVPEGAPTMVSAEPAEPATLAFIRSIRVYNVMHYSHAKQGRDEDCTESWSMQLGSYRADGHYSWSGLHPAAVPGWVGLSRSCNPATNYRGVAFEWTDYSGRHGTELVRY